MIHTEVFPALRAGVQESDISLARSLREWAQAELSAKRLELKEDYQGLLRPAMRSLFVDIGLQRAPWPEGLGGDGQSSPDMAHTLAVALQEAGRGDVGIAWLLALDWAVALACLGEGNGAAAAAVERMATLHCERPAPTVIALIPPLLEGRPRGSLASFRGKVVPLAVPRNGGWTLDAQGLRPLNSGHDADLLCVLCCTGEGEPLLLAVPGDSPGLERGQPFLKTGLAASRNADISLHDVEIDEGGLLLRGESAWRELLSWLYLGSSAVCTGALLAAYEIIKEWGDTRVIKGRDSIFKDNPLTASLMAEIGATLLACRLLTSAIAQMLAAPDQYGRAGEEGVHCSALAAWLKVGASAGQALDNTMELMASAGYAKEWQLERYWRDVRALDVSLGNRELARMELARYFYGSSAV
jgi:alkylation response protein AidB-like acyl-CoA dehydrogenase